MTLKQEEGNWTIVNLSNDKSRMLRRRRLSEAKSLEASNDMWYEILSRLPTKSLVISKCVCKAWRDFASHILVQQRKMPFLPTRGVFFEVTRFPSDDEININTGKYDSYLIYVSLTAKEIGSRIDSPCGNTVNYGYNEQLLGNLSLDLNPLYAKPCLIAKNGMSYTGHNGLILTVHIDGTYRVLNPATKQVLELPKPPNNREFFAAYGKLWMFNHAIINLSCPLSSIACSFVVMRFLRPHKLVDIYYPKTQKWVQCGFSLEDRQFNAGWYLANYVFLRECRTLFFLTTEGQGVALQFGSLHEPKICASYCFSLPKVVRNNYYLARLGESQGCLYLSHVDMEEDVDGIWIWKHCGDSSANPWILLFEVSKTTRLCKPVAEEHLVKFYDAECPIYLMGFHHEVAVVFIYVFPSLIFAYDFTNDTLDEIAILDKRERLKISVTHSYSPCLASLGPFIRCKATFCGCFFCTLHATLRRARRC